PSEARSAVLAGVELGASPKTAGRPPSPISAISRAGSSIPVSVRAVIRGQPNWDARYSRGTPGSSRTFRVMVNSDLILASNGGRHGQQHCDDTGDGGGLPRGNRDPHIS